MTLGYPRGLGIRSVAGKRAAAEPLTPFIARWCILDHGW